MTEWSTGPASQTFDPPSPETPARRNLANRPVLPPGRPDFHTPPSPCPSASGRSRVSPYPCPYKARAVGSSAVSRRNGPAPKVGGGTRRRPPHNPPGHPLQQGGLGARTTRPRSRQGGPTAPPGPCGQVRRAAHIGHGPGWINAAAPAYTCKLHCGNCGTAEANRGGRERTRAHRGPTAESRCGNCGHCGKPGPPPVRQCSPLASRPTSGESPPIPSAARSSCPPGRAPIRRPVDNSVHRGRGPCTNAAPFTSSPTGWAH